MKSIEQNIYAHRQKHGMHWLLLRLLLRAWALYCHTVVIPVKLHLIVISDMFAGFCRQYVQLLRSA